MRILRWNRGVGAVAAALVLFGASPLTASAALIDADSEIAVFGISSPTGGADLASATGLGFAAPATIAAGANDFAFATGGFATFNGFDFDPPALGTILTFAGGGAFTATSVTVDFQTATALDLTFTGFWSLTGSDDTGGELVLTADFDPASGVGTFSAGGTITQVIPVPGALLLFGSALIGLGAARRRRTA